jgi:hypothetical protein
MKNFIFDKSFFKNKKKKFNIVSKKVFIRNSIKNVKFFFIKHLNYDKSSKKVLCKFEKKQNSKLIRSCMESQCSLLMLTNSGRTISPNKEQINISKKNSNNILTRKLNKELYFKNIKHSKENIFTMIAHTTCSKSNQSFPKQVLGEFDENIIKKYNIKFCVFLGRKKNMKILHSYIQVALEHNIINEYHMYNFSRNIDDHDFIYIEFSRLLNLFPLRIFIHNHKENKELLNKPRTRTDWNPFYKKISEESNKNDIIIKCDDDILFIDIYSLKNAIEDRIKDTKSFLIHSNCINNGVCAYYQQNIFSKIKDQLNNYPKGGILGILFDKPEIAYAMHNQFCNDILVSFDNLNKYIIDDVYINTRISINFILIRGEDTKYFKDITFDDEYELSSLIPEDLLRPNKIKGDLLTAHYSYSFQEKIIFNRDTIFNNYKKIIELYLIKNKNFINKFNNHLENNLVPKIYKKLKDNSIIYTIKNWINENSYYIKNIESGKYIYINYEKDELTLSNNKTLFEINFKKNNLFEIKLGIYYFTRYNCKGKFRNENLLIKCLKDSGERDIIKENIDNEEHSFFIKFLRYKTYLSTTNDYLDNSVNGVNRWIFEKSDNIEEYIQVMQYKENKKIYYKNIKTNEVFTNYYLGWGYEGILSKI